MSSGNPGRTYLRLFVYSAIFTVTILATTVVLHEAGHFIAGLYDGCKGEIILLDSASFSTYTRLDCPETASTNFLYLFPFILVIPFALSFLALREFPEKYFSLMTLGIGIIAAGRDLIDVTGSELVSVAGIGLGIVLYVIGQFYLVDKMFSRFEERMMEEG